MKKFKRVLIIVCLAFVVFVLGCTGAWIVKGAYNKRFYGERLSDRAAGGSAREFFISHQGDDSNDGRSPERAWLTIGKVNAIDFAAGDCVLFEGGQTFQGNLQFDYRDAGTPARPIIVSSYGNGRATLAAGRGDGVRVTNTMGFRIENLSVVGSGYETSEGSGVLFENDLVGNIKLEHVRIDSVEVSGFGRWGIIIDGNNLRSGFRDVRITRVEAHDNRLAGVYVFGSFSLPFSTYAHEDVYIGETRAYNNPGQPGSYRKHSGSGIVVSDTNRAVIERSVAHDNGWLCESSQGGPVGIWAWDSSHVLIQFNESYGNRVAGRKDGGGFDLDGGMTDSVMQYNYSHDNDGAGYLLMQYENARTWARNTVRYNVSQNDGRKNGYPGIYVYGELAGAEIYNNVVFMSPDSEGRTPSALRLQTAEFDSWFSSEHARDVHVRNNILMSAGGATLVEIDEEHPGLLLQGNNYYAKGGPFRINWAGSTYDSLEGWRAATGQERIEGRDTGLSADPGLRAAGGGHIIGDASALASLDAYRLRDDSPLINAGLDLKQLFGVDAGAHDYYGAPLPQGARPDIGVHEAETSAATGGTR